MGVGSYANTLKRSRDSKRVSDMKDIRVALETYKLDHGDLPNETYPEGNIAGWEVSLHPNYMEYLKPYIHKTIEDPLNIVAASFSSFFTPRPKDSSFFYVYHYYNGGNTGRNYGCDFDGPFAVFGFRAAEILPTNNFPKARCGPMPCGDKGGTPNVCRDWSTEYDYSIIIRP